MGGVVAGDGQRPVLQLNAGEVQLFPDGDGFVATSGHSPLILREQAVRLLAKAVGQPINLLTDTPLREQARSHIDRIPA
jgi:hypothetical protein